MRGGGPCGQYISNKKKGEPSRQKEIRSAILYKEDCHVQQNRKDDPTMYRVRYLDQTDKMSEQVHLRMLEDVYPRELLQGRAQLSVTRAQKARRLRHFTALSVLWFVLAMVLWRDRKSTRLNSSHANISYAV